VRALIGGWQDRFAETGEIVRPVAFSMAAAHLRGTRDVVMPQYLGELREIEQFEAVLHDNSAVFCEIVVIDARQRSLQRFCHRGDNSERAWHQQVQQIVERTRAGTIGRHTRSAHPRAGGNVCPALKGRSSRHTRRWQRS
jgi:hypothetical protein